MKIDLKAVIGLIDSKIQINWNPENISVPKFLHYLGMRNKIEIKLLFRNSVIQAVFPVF